MLSLDIFLFFAFGATVGSFANVAIRRGLSGESLVRPRSYCPACKRQLIWFENIPLLSFLFLKAKCRTCSAPIPFRFFIVELLTAFLFMGAFLKLGYSFYLLEILVLFSGLVIVSFIDLDSFILPDKYTLTGLTMGLLGGLINPERSFWDAFAGALFGGGFFWAVAYLYFVLRKEDGLGGGDIKLLAWMGALLGWKSIPFIIIVGSFTGIAGALMTSKKEGLKTVIPFGPYLALGGVSYFFFGEWVSQAYLEFFLPMVFVSKPSVFQ